MRGNFEDGDLLALTRLATPVDGMEVRVQEEPVLEEQVRED